MTDMTKTDTSKSRRLHPVEHAFCSGRSCPRKDSSSLVENMLAAVRGGNDALEPLWALGKFLILFPVVLVALCTPTSHRWEMGAQVESLFTRTRTGPADPTHFIPHGHSLVCSVYVTSCCQPQLPRIFCWKEFWSHKKKYCDSSARAHEQDGYRYATCGPRTTPSAKAVLAWK